MSDEPKFTLVSQPKRERISAERFGGWSALYGRDGRTLRRWIEIGAEHDDPCPLDDPVQMPEWWERQRAAGRLSWRCPEEVTRAAQNAPLRSAHHEEGAAGQASGEVPQSAPGVPLQSAPTVPSSSPLDIQSYSIGEGEVVRNQRALVGAIYSQLHAAYLSGHATDVLQGRYNKAVEALRKLEKDDREDRKQRGLLIPRSAVQSDLDKAAELLRQMRESMERRVLELVPNLSPDLREAVAVAIRKVRSAEDRVFHRLPSLKEGADIEAALAEEAA